MERHGGNKAEAEAIWKRYENEIKIEPMDMRFEFVLEIFDLQNAGYPLKGNQITKQQWHWLSELKSEMQKYFSGKK